MEHLAGPNGAIAFERDALGYPSIHARDLAEGTYALGYLHARDRLVQVTFTALAARGELMSVLGDVPLARHIDNSTRALGLGRGLREQVERCDPESRSLLRAYCDGFNAGARARGTPMLLRLLKLAPFRCTEEGVISVFRFVTYFGLTSMQVSSELILAELAARGAPSRLFERLLGPKAHGLDLDALRKLEVPDELSFFAAAAQGSTQAGSNAFAVSARRSSTGGALLMGEFHMEIGRFPPLLYAAHLAFPDGEFLSGITIPGLAWFAAGRTRHVGWSYTFAHADNVDMLVERVQRGKVLVGGAYRPLERREERVAIRGKPAETWVFHENEYGTVLGDASGEGDRVCIRVSGFDQAHRAFSAASRVFRCRSVDELIEVQREVRSVSLEAILVDHEGSIASVVTGQVDRRPDDWTGAYPRRGSDLVERDPEPLPEARRPLSVRPESGLLVSANQGGQGPERDAWCSFPEPPYRFERISRLLEAREQHDLSSLLEISYDCFDASAERLIPVWGPLLPDHPLARALQEFATDQRDRRVLGLFHKLHEETCFALFAADIGVREARRFREWSAVVFYQNQLDSLLALEHPDVLGEVELRAHLQSAFFRAIEDFGRHDVPVRLRFKHLVTRGRSPAWLGFDSPEIELPGSPVTPFQCRVSPISGERLVYAPAFHLSFDMSQPHAFYNLPGGASESRFGPGYGLGIREWLEGTLLPLGKHAAPPPRRSKP